MVRYRYICVFTHDLETSNSAVNGFGKPFAHRSSVPTFVSKIFTAVTRHTGSSREGNLLLNPAAVDAVGQLPSRSPSVSTQRLFLVPEDKNRHDDANVTSPDKLT